MLASQTNYLNSDYGRPGAVQNLDHERCSGPLVALRSVPANCWLHRRRWRPQPIVATDKTQADAEGSVASRERRLASLV